MPTPPSASTTGNLAGVAQAHMESEVGLASPTQIAGASSKPSTDGTHVVQLGSSNVGKRLDEDRAQCVLNDDSSSDPRWSVSLGSAPEEIVDTPRVASMESVELPASSYDEHESTRGRSLGREFGHRSSHGSEPERRPGGLKRHSGSQTPRKTVSFNETPHTHSIPGRDIDGVNQGANRSSKSHRGSLQEYTEWQGEAAGFYRMRRFNWSVKRWQDILEPVAGKPNKSGLKLLNALTKKVYQSPPVLRALEIFSDARCLSESKVRNPLFEEQLGAALPQGLIFSQEEVDALDFARFSLEILMAELAPMVKSVADAVVWDQRKTRIEALNGIGIPHHEALLRMDVEDDPMVDTPQRFKVGQFSLGGQETSVSRSMLPVLFWAEFLAGMSGSQNQPSPGFDIPQTAGLMQVVVLSR